MASSYTKKFEEIISSHECYLKSSPCVREERWSNIFDSLPSQMKSFRVDYYFPKLKTIVEINGEQHYHPTSFSGDERNVQNYQLQNARDRELRALCHEHGLLYLGLHYKMFSRSQEELVGHINDSISYFFASIDEESSNEG